jgi:hypothetical protein
MIRYWMIKVNAALPAASATVVAQAPGPHMHAGSAGRNLQAQAAAQTKNGAADATLQAKRQHGAGDAHAAEQQAVKRRRISLRPRPVKPIAQ